MFMVQGPHFENHSSNPFFCFWNAPLAQESDQIFTTHSPYNTVSPQHEIRGLHNMFPAGVCSPCSSSQIGFLRSKPWDKDLKSNARKQ